MPPVDMSVKVGPLALPSPVLVGSGTFGFGEEYAPYCDLARLGAIVTKAVTLRPREGNPGPRIWETAAGMLNAIGLQNPGLERFLAEKLPPLVAAGHVVIVNIAGHDVEEYVKLAGALDAAKGVAAIEVNVSCPNVSRGGIEFGRDPAVLGELVRAVRGATRLPLIVKLSPNVSDIVPLAAAAMEAGADALSLINTLLGMAIDARQRRPRLANVTGGLSGPAIKPVALRMVWQVWQALRPPIIGMGGIMTGEDAAEFMLAGAAAVAVGTANFVDPTSASRVAAELEDFCRGQRINHVSELTGGLQV
ncbi:MAG: dihydroorotate dehydrogenase [Armatimonadetes bacterium]|nr:dihydroorotate dehydrogenase [Armatimonadota bacterium]